MNNRTAPILLTLCALFACQDDLGPDVLDREELIQDEIIANLLEADYPESEIELDDDGHVIVGGDAEVSLEAAREMAGERAVEPFDGEGFRQYRTNNLVDVAGYSTSSPRTLTVIGHTGSGQALDQTMRTALTEVVNDFNALNLKLRFQLSFQDSNNADIVVRVNGSGAGGSAGFPAGGNPYQWANIGSSTSNYGHDVVEHVIMHEIGHTIGMRHSDYYNRSISCGSGGNEGDAGVGANHIPGTPTTAVADGSLMNSCFHTGVNGELTATDVTALRELYGDPTFCGMYDGQLIALKTYHNNHMRAGNQSEGWVVNQVSWLAPWEKFTVQCVGDKAMFRTAHGTYVMAWDHQRSYAVEQSYNQLAWEQFAPVAQSGGKWAFRTHHGRYLMAWDNGSMNQQTFIGGWEQFTVLPQ